MATESDPLRAGPGEPWTVDDVRRIAERLLAWCDDDSAERQVLGSILIPLLPEVAARVRAEAVADERQRLASFIVELLTGNPRPVAALLETEADRDQG